MLIICQENKYTHWWQTKKTLNMHQINVTVKITVKDKKQKVTVTPSMKCSEKSTRTTQYDFLITVLSD